MKVTSNEDAKKDLISSIYESCFSQVSGDFLDIVTKEIAKRTGSQTVMIHRLLTSKEYVDLKYNEGCPHVQLIGQHEEDLVDIDNIDYDAKNLDDTEIKYLFVKACYSSIKDPTIIKYTAVPISTFMDSAPHIQAVQFGSYSIIQNNFIDNSFYPSFKSFVGIRLDDNETPIGLITVMHNEVMTEKQLELVQTALSTVRLRTKNEIARIRQKDKLIMMKNAALRDAESKIKFLAEMSHEIRTPMSAVVSLTDLMLHERHLLDDEQAEHLDVIQTSGNHLLTVINDILDISKLNHDPKFNLEYRRFSIRKCVKDALNMARHQALMIQNNKYVSMIECPDDLVDKDLSIKDLIQQLEKRQVLFHPTDTTDSVLPLIWNVDSDVPEYLMGDTMRLTQILLNLCSNAVKFTQSGGIRVRINVSKKSDSNRKGMSFIKRYDAKIDRHSYTRSSLKGRKNINNGSLKDRKPTISPTPSTESNEAPPNTTVLEISVTDTGIGMPTDRLPLLFKSFSQIDISTARRYGGTGLGLAISSMLVNRMGGVLWVESEEGVGSRFALTLPITISSEPSPSPSSQPTSTEIHSSLDQVVPSNPLLSSIDSPIIPKPSQHHLHIHKPHTQYKRNPTTQIDPPLFIHPPKILFAEDNVLNQKIASSILKRLGYKDIVIAGNGREALDLMNIHSFDVVFMDLYMPKMDGLEATKHIMSERKKECSSLLNVKDVYIIALTASASPKDRQICIDAGMNDFISKPFTMTEIEAVLKTLAKIQNKKNQKENQK